MVISLGSTPPAHSPQAPWCLSGRKRGFSAFTGASVHMDRAHLLKLPAFLPFPDSSPGEEDYLVGKLGRNQAVLCSVSSWTGELFSAPVLELEGSFHSGVHVGKPSGHQISGFIGHRGDVLAPICSIDWMFVCSSSSQISMLKNNAQCHGLRRCGPLGSD